MIEYEKKSKKIEEYILDFFEFEESLNSLCACFLRDGLFDDIKQISNVLGYLKIRLTLEQEFVKVTNLK